MKKYVVILLVLVACGSETKQEPLDTVKNFLAWYGVHYKEANTFALVNQGDSVYYSVNFEETEKFLAYMKASGFVSDTYLDDFRTYFKEADEVFKKDPVNEGPPQGFDFDIVLLTQEPDVVIEKGTNPTVLSSEADDTSAKLNLDVYIKLQFLLSKQAGTWKIDRISTIE